MVLVEDVQLLTGAHNQRIERLWIDIFLGCVSFLYSLFYSLEDIGELGAMF